jgi:hypothetical protein
MKKQDITTAVKKQLVKKTGYNIIVSVYKRNKLTKRYRTNSPEEVKEIEKKAKKWV